MKVSDLNHRIMRSKDSVRCMGGSGLAGRLARACWRDLASTVAGLLALGLTGANAESLTTDQIMKRPVFSRVYEQDRWTLRDATGTGLRETPTSVGLALAALRPTYVSGLVYLHSDAKVTDAMMQDYATIRSEVLAKNPQARFDIEISLNPRAHGSVQPFASPAALLAYMDQLNAQFHPDGWWFDFYSNAQTDHPDWIVAAAAYAHARGQTIGGNVFNGVVPPNSDAVAFVDNPVTGSVFGFDFSVKEIKALKSSSPSTIILGHLQNNPQNGSSTESCVYIQQWTTQERFLYLGYWASQQKIDGFRFEYPVFFPECPVDYMYDPLQDLGTDSLTLYQHLMQLMDEPVPK